MSKDNVLFRILTWCGGLGTYAVLAVVGLTADWAVDRAYPDRHDHAAQRGLLADYGERPNGFYYPE